MIELSRELLSERLAALSQVERNVLTLMAIVAEPLNRSRLVAALRTAQLRNARERVFSTTELLPMLAAFEAAGLVTSQGDADYRVRLPVAHTLLLELVGTPRLTSLVNAVRAERPVEKYGSWLDEEAAARELWLSLYLGAAPAVPGLGAREEGALERRLWRRALGTEPPRAVLERMPEAARQLYLEELFEEITHDLFVLGNEVYELACAHAARLSDEAAVGLAVAATLIGRAEDGLVVTGDRNEPHVIAARAFAELARGRYDEGRAEARRSLELTVARSSGRVKGLKGPLSRWVNILLLSGDNPRGHELARAQLASKWAITHDRYLTLAAHALDGFRNGVIERPEARADLALAESVYTPQDWSSLLAWCLMRRMRNQALSRTEQQELRAHAASARAHRYEWLASEFERVAAGTPNELGRLARADEPWERSLRGLEAALDDLESASRGQPGQERLVWSLVVQGGTHQLAARLQLKTPSGYSSGRQASWKTLLEGQHEPWMTAEDQRVLRTLSVETADARSGALTYAIARDAPLALIGHPHVFGDYECKQPVVVARGLPRIEVEARAGDLHLGIVPRGLPRDGVLCVREAHDRILVYGLSAQQAMLAGLLEKPLVLPASARERARALLARLIEHFPVASDLELSPAESWEEVAGDARPCIDLRPLGQGLSARLSVVPAGEGQSFPPGSGPASVFARVDRDGTRVTVRCMRDLALERARVERLLEACPELEGADGGRSLLLEDRGDCLELLLALVALGDDIRLRWPEGQSLKVLGERGARNLRLRVISQQAWLTADGELEVDETTKVAMHELLARFATRTGRFVELASGQFVALTSELERTLEALAGNAEEQQGKLVLHPLVADVLFTSGAFNRLETDRSAQERLAKLETARDYAPALPKGFEAELRPYQLAGFTFLSRLALWGAGACLADDMGLGKTLQTLAFLLAQAEHGPSLVVAPLSVCDNWLSEAQRFAPGLRLSLFATEERETLLDAAGPFDVIVASYGLLQQEIERLEKRRFRVIVLDEAQAIKNAQTQRAQAAFRLVGEHRIALTGTPVENHLGELWSIFAFLNPGLLGTARAFEARFGKPIERDGDERAAHGLKRLIKPFVLRRKKAEVLEDLPPKTEITLRVEPGAEELALLEALREGALARLASAGPANEQRFRVLAEIMKLRRAACHPRLVAPDLNLESAKLKTFEAIVTELIQGGHRALVFSQFVDYLGLVRERLDELGVSYQYLDGSCSRPARAAAVAAFQRGEGQLFLISLRAGGFGLNLAAADYVIHLDPWWNPAVEDQASDRAHRIGQTRPVTVYRLVMRGSIEEKIVRLHHDKRELVGNLLEGASQGSSLSVAELIALLRDERPRETRAPGGATRPLPRRGYTRPT